MTKINWCVNPDGTPGEVWNPVTGCTPAGVGCQHCYAATMAKRFWGDRPFSDVRCHPEREARIFKLRKPKTIFVNSMSDLFHPDVPSEFISRTIDSCGKYKKHTFVVLTKRIERARDLADMWAVGYPANVVLGVSCSTQAEVDRMVPVLLDTPAAKRIVSLEPLVEAVTLLGAQDTAALIGMLDGVIVGGESGPGARPMHPNWVRSLRDECAAADVPFFFKQYSACNEWGPPWRKNRSYRKLDGRTHDDLPWCPPTERVIFERGADGVTQYFPETTGDQPGVEG